MTERTGSVNQYDVNSNTVAGKNLIGQGFNNIKFRLLEFIFLSYEAASPFDDDTLSHERARVLSSMSVPQVIKTFQAFMRQGR
jgi:hypothetical protein